VTWNEECGEYRGNLVVKCAVAVCRVKSRISHSGCQ